MARGAAPGDRRALRVLYEEYSEQLFAIAYRLDVAVRSGLACTSWAQYRLLTPEDPLLAQQHRARVSVLSPPTVIRCAFRAMNSRAVAAFPIAGALLFGFGTAAHARTVEEDGATTGPSAPDLTLIRR